MSAPRHSPGPLGAVGLCLAAWFATASLIVIFGGIDPENPGAGLDIGILGIAQALGMGLVATLGARAVPAPQADRLGLRGFELRWLVAIACLLPLSLVVSELQNLAELAAPAPDAEEILERTRERLDTKTPLAAVETMIVAVGLAPVVEEWLYRGVVQQGLIAHLGRMGGILTTAFLFSLAHFQPTSSAASSFAVFAATLPVGLVLGLVRLSTGSLLAAILVHASYNAVGLAGVMAAPWLPIAGYNAPGIHTPLWLVLPCTAVVVMGLVPLLRDAGQVEATPPLPEPVSESDESGSGWRL